MNLHPPNLGGWRGLQGPFGSASGSVNSVHTRCLVKTSFLFLQGVFVKIGDFSLNLKVFLVGIPREQAILRKAKTPENRQKGGLFWASPFTMHLVYTLLSLFRVRVGSISGCWVGSGWGSGRRASVREKKRISLPSCTKQTYYDDTKIGNVASATTTTESLIWWIIRCYI